MTAPIFADLLAETADDCTLAQFTAVCMAAIEVDARGDRFAVELGAHLAAWTGDPAYALGHLDRSPS